MNLVRGLLDLASRRNIRCRRDMWVYVTRMSLYIGLLTAIVTAFQCWFHDEHNLVPAAIGAFLVTSLLALPIAWEFGRMYLDLWEATRSLHSLARTDQQTGLLNNRSFVCEVEDHLAGGRQIALLLGDLDRFKSINDRHGHLVGDQVIARVGEAIRELFGSPAVLGRMGGEEYAVALDCPFFNADTAERHATAFAEELRRRVEAILIPSESGVVVPTISIGISWSARGGGFSDLYRRADKALYFAKAAGRNRVVGEQEIDLAGIRMRNRTTGADAESDCCAGLEAIRAV